jgi:hypothetical protein
MNAFEFKEQCQSDITLVWSDLKFYESEFQRLLTLLETSGATTDLPESPSARPALDDLLKRVRMRF